MKLKEFIFFYEKAFSNQRKDTLSIFSLVNYIYKYAPVQKIHFENNAGTYKGKYRIFLQDCNIILQIEQYRENGAYNTNVLIDIEETAIPQKFISLQHAISKIEQEDDLSDNNKRLIFCKKQKNCLFIYVEENNIYAVFRYDNVVICHNITKNIIKNINPLPFKFIGKAERKALQTLYFRLDMQYTESYPDYLGIFYCNNPTNMSLWKQKTNNNLGIDFFYRNVHLFTIFYEKDKQHLDTLVYYY